MPFCIGYLEAALETGLVFCQTALRLTLGTHLKQFFRRIEPLKEAVSRNLTKFKQWEPPPN